MTISRIAPLLGTHDLQKTIAFYTDLLGFTLAATWPEDNPGWCNLTSGDASVMFSVYDGSQSLDFPGVIYLYPDEIDTLWQRLKDKTEVDAELQTMDYGMREFTVHDPNGYHLSFGVPAG